MYCVKRRSIRFQRIVWWRTKKIKTKWWSKLDIIESTDHCAIKIDWNQKKKVGILFHKKDGTHKQNEYKERCSLKIKIGKNFAFNIYFFTIRIYLKITINFIYFRKPFGYLCALIKCTFFLVVRYLFCFVKIASFFFWKAKIQCNCKKKTKIICNICRLVEYLSDFNNNKNRLLSRSPYWTLYVPFPLFGLYIFVVFVTFLLWASVKAFYT